MRIHVDEPNDPQIAVFLGLRDQEARKARELPGGDMAGLLIAEGDVVIERALAHGLELHSILIPEGRTSPLPAAVPESANVFLANSDVLTEITGRPALRDTLSCFIRPEPSHPVDIIAKSSVIAFLENVNNPNNLGVIIRNAAGLGVDAIMLDGRCGDPLYRRAIRASMGQVFAIPHARVDSTSEGLSILRDHQFRTVALTPAGDVPLREVDPAGKTAVVLGAEGPGLDADSLAAADIRCAIPMANEVDSLNVANAAAIAFHHFVR